MSNILSIQMSVFLLFFFFVLGAIGSLVLKSNRLINGWSNGCALLGSLFGMLVAWKGLFTDIPFFYSISSSFPLLSFSLRMDKLAAFFVLIISLSAALCSLYAFGYVVHYYKKYSIGALGFFYNMFLLGMTAVVMAENALFFLIVWEIMSLASYFLVIYERHNGDNVRAGYVYFVMTHLGTAFIIVLFVLLYHFAGSFDFTEMKEHVVSISPLLAGVLFVLALIGFGTKAGIIPFHIWLPSAHPAAPSHVSALMSGVMIKTGVYMIIRVTMDILPQVSLWWGLVILVIGSASAILGILYAISEHDIKRLLAYSSIENIGIIFLGLGSALTFIALKLPELAVIGFVASLFHIMNHSILKSLLFLSAGSVIAKTHTRNMERYGGLIKYMPHTAFFFLVGSMSISALPPFNGFFSEWLTFQALFSGIQSFSLIVKWVFVFSAGALALTSGLVLACFVKAFGISFLARPRSEEVTHSSDGGGSLWASMGIFSFLALAVGIFSTWTAGLIQRVAQDFYFLEKTEITQESKMQEIIIRNGFASVSGEAIFWTLVFVLLGVYLAVRLITRQNKVKSEITWDCGATLNSRMEITSLGFSRAIITIFRGVLKPTRQSQAEYRDASMRYFSKINFSDETRDLYREYLYHPMQHFINKTAICIKKIQGGLVNVYVLYILITLIGLLIFLAVS